MKKANGVSCNECRVLPTLSGPSHGEEFCVDWICKSQNSCEPQIVVYAATLFLYSDVEIFGQGGMASLVGNLAYVFYLFPFTLIYFSIDFFSLPLSNF